VLATHDSVTLCEVAWLPVPLNATAVGEFEALLTKDRLPGSEPLMVGVKSTVNDALLPAAIVAGNEIPLRT
jgi:hypothetical protein